MKAFIDKSVTQMRAKEAGGAGDQYTLTSHTVLFMESAIGGYCRALPTLS